MGSVVIQLYAGECMPSVDRANDVILKKLKNYLIKKLNLRPKERILNAQKHSI